MARTLGVTQILDKNYKMLDNVPDWIVNILGRLPDPFYIQVIGRPKNGKTTFAMQVVKGLAMSGYNVWYNSKEEGDCVTIQDAYKLVGMKVVKGYVFLGDGYYFDDMMEYLHGPGKRKKIVVIDSLDYMKLTKRQFIKLTETFPSKSFMVLCWGGKKGHEWVCDDYYGNQIRHMMGSIVGVQDYIVESRGRYGPTELYSVYPEKYPIKKQHNGQLAMYN